MERVKRRWWTVCVTALASLVLFGALLSALFQLAVMALPGYREQLSGYVSRVANRPIEIGGVALGWRGLAPRLDLENIVLYAEPDDATPALSAERLRIGFGLLRLLRGDTFPDRIELSGLELVAEIDEHDRLRLRGLDTAGGQKTQYDWSRELSRFDAILLEDCSLLLDDARLGGEPTRLRLLHASARRRIGGASFEGLLELPDAVGESVELEGRVHGDLARIETLQGRWSLAVENLARLPWLEARLPGRPRLQFEATDLTLAGGIERGRFQGVEMQAQAAAVSAHRGSGKARLHDLQFEARARPSGSGWTLEVPALQVSGDSGPWPATSLRLHWNPLAPAGHELEVDADYLRLQDLLPWFALGGAGPLARLQGLSGEINALVARARLGQGRPTYSLRARLQGLSLAPAERMPGLSGLSGELSATETGGRLSLAAAPFELRYPRLFAQPLPLEQLSGRLDWTREAVGWRLSLPEYRWQGLGTQGEGQMQLLLPADPAQSAQLVLAARFSGEDVTRLKPYKPLVWGEHLRNWLDRAILAGRLPRGELKLEGRLADFPFSQNRGLFSLALDVADGRLAFAPDWPAAEQVVARLQFRDGGLSIDGEGGRLSGNRVGRFQAQIPEFKDAELAITGEVEGDGARFYDFLRASPLAPRLSGLLTRTRVAGPASVSLSIGVPLRDVRQTQVQGRALLKGVELQYGGLDEPFRDLRGAIEFDNDGVSAQGVTGTLYGVPATAALYPLGRGVTRLEAGFEYGVQADGAGLSRYVPVFLRPRLQGSSQWRAEIVLGRDVGAGLALTTDLRGVAVDLPAPLGKAAETPTPLVLGLGGSETAGLRVGVSYGARLGADVVFETAADGTLQARRALLRLGSGEVPSASEDGLRIIGQVADLDLGTWLAAFTRGALESPTAQGLSLQGVQLQVAQLRLQGHAIEDLRLAYRPEADGWSASLQGERADGELRWRRQPEPQLQARFKRLQLSAREQSTPAAATRAPADPIDPGLQPTLDIDCESLRLGDAQLGRLRLVTTRVDAGQQIQLFDVRGGELALSASGEWLRRGGASSARLGFEVQSREVSRLLRGLGYAENLSAEQSRFDGQLSWPASAAGLEWAQASGKLKLDLQRGTLRAVEPGAGRVLGLINFYALPRRLTLDFSDVVSRGLGFDRVRGSFDLGGGNAVTQDLAIIAPSLKMELRGRVGLAARDYDQRVTVYPDVSAGFTLGALLLGGPAAGALALIAQEVLDKPLDQATQLSYRVTGSWDNPQIERGDGGAPPALPATAPDVGGSAIMPTPRPRPKPGPKPS